MFYCDPCKDAAGWPTSIFKSHGQCEMCYQVDSCNDVPSFSLPRPKVGLQDRLHSLKYEPKHAKG